VTDRRTCPGYVPAQVAAAISAATVVLVFALPGKERPEFVGAIE